MITCEVLKVLRLKVPHYRVLSPKFVKGSFSICPCAACKNVLREDGHYICGRVEYDLELFGCRGNAIVSAYGSCDAAKFCPENYDNFRLEQETVAKTGDGSAANGGICASNGSGEESTTPTEQTPPSPVSAPISEEGGSK